MGRLETLQTCTIHSSIAWLNVAAVCMCNVACRIADELCKANPVFQALSCAEFAPMVTDPKTHPSSSYQTPARRTEFEYDKFVFKCNVNFAKLNITFS